jgi:PAS domain-containing protein
MITTDIEGRVTYLNAVAESLTGWTQPEAGANRWTPSFGSSTTRRAVRSRAPRPGR